MRIQNYTRRCKRKTGDERHSTLHAADNHKTFCGKHLDEMWFIESSAGLTPADVTCKECLKAMTSPKTSLADYPLGTVIGIGDRRFERVTPGTFWREQHAIPGNCVSRPSTSITNIEHSAGVAHVVLFSPKAS